MTTAPARPETADIVLTRERLLGDERRWRRFGAPVAAGDSAGPDGEPDVGVFGPGSVVWEVLLHPAVIVFETAAQGTAQMLYKPIAAGIRDRDPISRKAAAGTLTIFDAFERFQRNAGMHAPMWFGDTATATRMATHLHRIHGHVHADVIDAGDPGLGGYAAAGPRDAMWAALTEMHPVLRLYEAFAFRDGRLPHRLDPAERDRYVAEAAAYVRLTAGDVEEIPTSTAELAALYARDAALFGRTASMDVVPETGESHSRRMASVIAKNFHVSQLRAAVPLLGLVKALELPVMGALSATARRGAGYGPVKSRLAALSTRAVLPLVWLMQQPAIERHFLRLFWGPDGVTLIDTARRRHAQAKAERMRPATATAP